MKKVFIGHRGVGKTSLLKRHMNYFSETKHFDLDKEIEKVTKSTIAEYFQKYGEVSFRNIEAEIFKEISKNNFDYVVSLGAGFDIASLADDIEILYISRSTDADGRVFLNRPRLEVSLNLLDEYKKRFIDRNEIFLKKATHVYHLPEGIVSENNIEKIILTQDFVIKDAYYTLTFQEINYIKKLVKLFKNIELRTDLLSIDSIKDLLIRYPQHNWLISVRSENFINFKKINNIDVDFKYYFKGCQIISTHTDLIDEGISQLSKVTEKLHLKLCPLIDTFADLIKGYNWQQLDPNNRSFLPRSTTGKWIWYRQLSKYLQRINFVKNKSENIDQPSLSEWLVLPEEKPSGWGAVLGQPIHFSRSPIEHQSYFLAQKSFFTRIDLNAEELEYNLKFIIDLGLKFAAITAPLKQTALKISNKKSELSLELKSANTLYIEKHQVSCHNTDMMGFKKLVRSIRKTDKVAIWGGGGTLAMMQKILPGADLFSSQTGLQRGLSDSTKFIQSNYDYLIWAAPRTDKPVWPQNNFEIKTLLDLNYTDNSLGLEFAAYRKISYKSGLEMFELQALLQQEFWSLNERK